MLRGAFSKVTWLTGAFPGKLGEVLTAASGLGGIKIKTARVDAGVGEWRARLGDRGDRCRQHVSDALREMTNQSRSARDFPGLSSESPHDSLSPRQTDNRSPYFPLETVAKYSRKCTQL